MMMFLFSTKLHNTSVRGVHMSATLTDFFKWKQKPKKDKEGREQSNWWSVKVHLHLCEIKTVVGC
jgi:hypothetical protein